MQRSLNENDNVQFVQELAEVDGPFESPININFRDLTKLELPSLAWNRSECIPKKMKITNTGHTVIVSGKWKTERPYLTGGPLVGKYVFSQIHFHWGHDDFRGSEHQVCGESFPLEMHVAHFKTDYLTQECALREKDGMVVVVYLFKLQEEPNLGLRKILGLLPSVKQASTSQALDPQPILSLCNPFTDDYYMYWGSVVTSTCAHILLWIICREPFGISREQVNEFRKICDSTQQPVCKNSRETQPLHSRNVFHVNASKNLDDPLLPIKKMMGCYCKGSGENVSIKSPTRECLCQAQKRNQEEIEGNRVAFKTGYRNLDIGGEQALIWKAGLSRNLFVHQSLFVQSTLVEPAPLLPKRFNSENIRGLSYSDELKQTKSERNSKLVSQSCCFFPMNEINNFKNRQEKRKPRGRRLPFNSIKALSNIMDSLEALKNHTFKKLKEIESINQEIKGMKSFCQDTEDKRWLRRIEKMMSRQKQFTIRASQGCFGELKKLAKECNFDRFFDNKLSVGDDNQKFIWFNTNEANDRALPCSDVCLKDGQQALGDDKALVKPVNVSKAMKFSAKAQKLIQSFFEDIKESEDLHQSVQKNLQLKKIGSLCSREGGDSTSVKSMTKGFITQKMFALQNLGDRLFTEVKTEDIDVKDNGWGDKLRSHELIISLKDTSKKEFLDNDDGDKSSKINLLEKAKIDTEITFNNEEIIPLHRANVTVEFSPRKQSEQEQVSLISKIAFLSDKVSKVPQIEITTDSESTLESAKIQQPYSVTSYTVPKKPNWDPKPLQRDFDDFKFDKMMNEINPDDLTVNFQYSSSSLSTDSTETQRIIIAKFHKKTPRKDIWKQKSSIFARVSSKSLYEKTRYKKQKQKNINFKGYYVKKKNLKNEKKNIQRGKKMKEMTSSCEVSTSSKEGIRVIGKKSKWKKLTKAKFKLEISKTSDSTLESALDSLTSPKRKKVKLDFRKTNKNISEANKSHEKKQMYATDSETSKSMNDVGHQVTSSLPSGRDTNENPLTPKKVTTENTQKIITRIHIPRSSANESRDPSGASTTRTFRASSADSKFSLTEKQEIFKQEENRGLPLQIKEEPIKKETQKLPFKKLIKNRSLTNLPEKFRFYPNEISKRVFVENLEDRRKSARETAEFIKKLESPRKFEEIPKIMKIIDKNRVLASETFKKSERDEEQKELNNKNEEIKTQKIQKYSVGFFTTDSNHTLQELSSKPQQPEEKSKIPTSRRCEVEKYHFLDKELEELKASPKESIAEPPELAQTESNASQKKEELAVKESTDLPKAESQNLQTSVSCSRIKKNPQSRPHSAESLSTQIKSSKRKSKKRPHCCKRSSRHYIKKNPSIFRKPNKVESKSINFLGLTEEEQLKIISVNVAKYLKQKLVEHKRNLDLEKKCSFKEIEEVILKNLKASEEKPKENPVEEIPLAKETESKSETPVTVKSNEKIKKEKPETPTVKDIKNTKGSCESPKDKKTSGSSRPVHNFIKINKLMAGKYKRLPAPAERKAEIFLKKKDEPKKESPKSKTKTLKKKKEKFPSSKQVEELKPQSKVSSPPNKPYENAPITRPKPVDTARLKSPITPTKRRSDIKKPAMTPPASENPKEELKSEKNSKKTPATSLAMQKIPPPKKRWVPAYMVTSYLPAPIEVIETQQRKINKYLLNMKNQNSGNYLPEVFYELNSKDEKSDPNKKEPLLTKDLEYLIRLQRCLNNEILSNIENSMNYVKTLLNQDYLGTTVIEKTSMNEPLDYNDTNSKGVILIEMNELLDSSSSSDCGDDLERLCLHGDGSQSKLKLKVTEISQLSIPKESGDSEFLNPALIEDFDGVDDKNSDSSYNCEISITLNPSTTEADRELQICDLSDFTNNYIYDVRKESNTSQTTTQLEGESSSQSLILRPHRRKRKENEISVEMKQKLLEILEGEIKREMALTYGISPETSSDGLTLRWDDSDGINRSQSTDSSCDNLEVLAQISETMRQYLTDFKERRLLAQRIDEVVDNDSKGEDES